MYFSFERPAVAGRMTKVTQGRLVVSKKKVPTKASYTVMLDRAVVCKLRQIAAERTLTSGRSVTWLDCLREAAQAVADKGGK